MTVYNVAGEPVFEAAEEGKRGLNEFVWNGSNVSGAKSASGIYVVYLKAAAADGGNGQAWAYLALAR